MEGMGHSMCFYANNWNNECYSKKAAPIPFLSTHHHMHHLHTICALFAHTMHTPCTHQVHTSQTPLTYQKFEKSYFLDKVKNKFNASMVIQNTCFLEWLLKSKGNLKVYRSHPQLITARFWPATKNYDPWKGHQEPKCKLPLGNRCTVVWKVCTMISSPPHTHSS